MCLHLFKFPVSTSEQVGCLDISFSFLAMFLTSGVLSPTILHSNQTKTAQCNLYCETPKFTW